MARAVTLRDVAQLAGVSLSTASRVLNGSTRSVGEQLRHRVTAVARELDYAPNAPARAMVRGHVDVVGVVVHDIDDPYFSAVASGVMRRAERTGLLVAVSSTLRRPERDADYVAAFRRQRVRAVILVGSRTTDRVELERLRTEVERFQATGARVAAVSQPHLPVDSVVVENQAGAQELAGELVGLGYRRFAVLAGPATLATARDRLAGFRAGFARHGVSLPEEHVIPGEFTRDGGYAAMRRALRQGLDVECVCAVNDVMAVGALAALRDQGLRLPAGIAVTGFDDIATARDVTPRLTTVRVDLEQLGDAALHLVLSDPVEVPRVRRLRGRVVIRESTPPLRHRL
ncbi:LacI family DNA-binding transcriptional regulator [Peterkaempfera sp. SMS 1(5)a]|uniref:LacI family DNA-binding transcriptional regulator n=1 Tax=Peterkaempfera podocarpi TaxID=3232308 RepID=UPI00366E6E86